MKIWLTLFLFFIYHCTVAQQGIRLDTTKHVITITAPKEHLKIEIVYANGCYISKLFIKGKNKLSPAGVYTSFAIDSSSHTSKDLITVPRVQVQRNMVTISAIRYGDTNNGVEESWLFIRKDSSIQWKLSRKYAAAGTLKDIAFPQWHFASMSTWKAGIINNGGVVWCKYLEGVNDSYGVHTGGTIYWNDISGEALSIQTKAANGQYIATQYSHSPQGEFTSTQMVTAQPLTQQHQLSRFVHGKRDVFAPTAISKTTVSATIDIRYIDYFTAYDRGDLKKINAAAVRELLNTTARYGVVDNNIVGGNGWVTNWKCLHEPFFGQIALALADSNYTNNLAGTLDQERDQAMLPDGRVLSRWHDVTGDEIPGTYNKETGYYEAMWGYTMDSQTGYVINVSDLFNINGNRDWLKRHQNSCRKALDWLLRRDSNHNGIYEMMNSNTSEGKCSDWLDIVWASFENAFVNAQLYAGLVKWADCERVLGDAAMAEKYKAIADRLKQAFNQPVEQGGFWSATKKQFVYWRDKDGTVHGDNLVTPVQFMAIASGICDEKDKIKEVLGQIETRTADERLFHWPLCFDSFKREEVDAGNWPFPKYENGDIFPTWGYLGVQSYLHYNQALALKYIRNLLEQYQKDGLSSQRYSRKEQQGQGGDILSGICTGVTALYSDIYGVQPRWNRLVIAPNIVDDLNGTRFTYALRGHDYTIQLDTNNYHVHSGDYAVNYNKSFGTAGKKGNLQFFPGDQDSTVLAITNHSSRFISLTVHRFAGREIDFAIKEKGQYAINLKGLSTLSHYTLIINGLKKTATTSRQGEIILNIDL
ncbi:MAG: hypothetical protein QM726_10205 [Chitinophagaceae bacterium]